MVFLSSLHLRGSAYITLGGAAPSLEHHQVVSVTHVDAETGSGISVGVIGARIHPLAREIFRPDEHTLVRHSASRGVIVGLPLLDDWGMDFVLLDGPTGRSAAGVRQPGRAKSASSCEPKLFIRAVQWTLMTCLDHPQSQDSSAS